jgi:hypothetical protein
MPPNGITIEIASIALAIILIITTLWLINTPLEVKVGFVGVDNTTFIYVVSITPSSAPYWVNHASDTVYGITAYTGNITINCPVKPHPPFIITRSTPNSPNYTLYITLECPVAITSVSVNATSGVVSVNVPFPNQPPNPSPNY